MTRPRTGAYGYPPEAACRVAVATAREFLAAHAGPERVIFVCFSAPDLRLYESALGAGEQAVFGS